MDKKDVLELIQKEKIEVIRLWFTDILGRVKGFNLVVDELDRALNEGIGFDGSSIEGFVRIEESDLLACPDIQTAIVLPGDFGGAKTLVFQCDIRYPDGSPYESDPRYILKKNLEYVKKQGWTFFVGPELEYFYFPSRNEPYPIDQEGYFDVFPFDKAVLARKETFLSLRNMGISLEASHHEVASSQHEIDFRYTEALKMADTLQLAKMVIRQIAQKYGIHATFMPKPVFGLNGSGLHCHQSLFSEENNTFYSPDGPYNLSKTAGAYIGGLLKYAREITLITNQWTNSYKRLVVGYEAPVYLSWGRRNRSALVRVPAFKPHRPKSCRIEYRAPDPGCNPYLAFAVMLRAGLQGIQDSMELPEPIEKDIYAMPEEVKKEYRIGALPDSLYAAILETEKSTLVKETLGEILFNKFIENKKTEWENYRIQVTDYEIKKYLPML